jgi:hypothetical protein
VTLCGWVSGSPREAMPSSSRMNQSKKELLECLITFSLEDESTNFLRSVGIHSLNDRALNPEELQRYEDK